MSMISPEAYVIGLQDADYTTLIKERNELIESIQEFEKKEKAADRSGDEWNIMPSPEVRYKVKLIYLSELCRFMADKYNKTSVVSFISE